MSRDFRSLPAAVVVALALAHAAQAQAVTDWPQHSLVRPKPRIVSPAPASAPVRPPADAIVLFDGKDLAKWQSTDTVPSAPRWKIAHGFVEVVPGAGEIETTQAFADVQLHVEWAAPLPAKGDGQERGNSGVFLMGRYEVQVLDSYHNETYADGQAAAIFGQYPPLANASRPPGEWQSYDIVFHAPRFGADGALVKAARFTVLHNGVLVQDNVEVLGPTSHARRAPYEAHPDHLPLKLQNHGHRVRYRNIWIRPL
ncbi:MAG: DUF1080 domain-containing protein [Gemmatimonadaceae bacterium]